MNKYLDDKFSTMQYASSSCNSKVGAQQTTKTRTAATTKRVDFILALATALWIVPFLLLFHKLTAIFPYAKNMYNRGTTNATTRERVGAQFLRYWHWSIFAKGNGPASSHYSFSPPFAFSHRGLLSIATLCRSTEHFGKLPKLLQYRIPCEFVKWQGPESGGGGKGGRGVKRRRFDILDFFSRK